MTALRFTKWAAAACCALAAVVVVGCESAEDTATMPAATQSAMVAPGALSVCTGCGQFKGSELCCAEGQTMCAGCGLVKGSPGCCKIE